MFDLRRTRLLSVSALLAFTSLSGFAAKLPAGARIFIELMPDGFNTYLQAAIIKKHVPVTIVGEEARADYLIVGTAETVKAGWAKTIFVTPKADANASITVREAKTGDAVYGYAVDKFGARHGQQSTAESCAKHLKEFIEKN